MDENEDGERERAGQAGGRLGSGRREGNEHNVTGPEAFQFFLFRFSNLIVTCVPDRLVSLEALGFHEDLAAVRARADGRPSRRVAARIDDRPALVAAGQPPQRHPPPGGRRPRRRDQRRRLAAAGGDARLGGGGRVGAVDDAPPAGVGGDVVHGAERGAGGQLGVPALAGGGGADALLLLRGRGVVDMRELNLLAGEEILEELP